MLVVVVVDADSEDDICVYSSINKYVAFLDICHFQNRATYSIYDSPIHHVINKQVNYVQQCSDRKY